MRQFTQSMPREEMGDLMDNEFQIPMKFNVCPICGKNFIPAPEHGWRVGSEKEYKLVCSYTCMRVWEKEKYEKED